MRSPKGRHIRLEEVRYQRRKIWCWCPHPCFLVCKPREEMEVVCEGKINTTLPDGYLKQSANYAEIPGHRCQESSRNPHQHRRKCRASYRLLVGQSPSRGNDASQYAVHQSCLHQPSKAQQAFLRAGTIVDMIGDLPSGPRC